MYLEPSQIRAKSQMTNIVSHK